MVAVLFLLLFHVLVGVLLLICENSFSFFSYSFPSFSDSKLFESEVEAQALILG